MNNKYDITFSMSMEYGELEARDTSKVTNKTATRKSISLKLKKDESVKDAPRPQAEQLDWNYKVNLST